jgi:hypothetical protein
MSGLGCDSGAKNRLSQLWLFTGEWFLEDPAVLRKEGSAGPRYLRASGKSLETLLFYGVVVVGVVTGASPGEIVPHVLTLACVNLSCV